MSGSAQKQNNPQDVSLPTSPPPINIDVPKVSDIDPPSKSWKSVELPRDILLLTVKDPEFSSCYAYLKKETIFKSYNARLGWVYCGKIGNSEGVKVCLLRCDMGTATVGGALNVVKDAASIVNPKAVVCVGFCGGLNRRKAKLGDVVISAKLATYSSKKVTKDGEQSRNIKTNVSRNMNALIGSAANGWKAPVAPLKKQEAFEVKVHSDGVILSGPELVDSDERAKQLLHQYPDAIAIEMEGEGIYAAAFNLEIEWLVVKGISDYADGTKSQTEGWQKFASVMAASVVHNLLKEPAILEHWPHYKGTSCTNPVGREHTDGGAAVASALSAVYPDPSPSHENAKNENSLIGSMLSVIGGSSDAGQINYKGRVIEYEVRWRMNTLLPPGVYDGSAWDIESGITGEKTGCKASKDAKTGAVSDLIRKLKNEGIINNQ